MAKGNFNACLDVTLPHEGGYVDHPSDPGGATNMGITHKTLAEWRGKSMTVVTKQDVRNLSLAEARQIYESRYWRPVSGDNLPYGVDLAVFDFGVNSGPSRSARYLQRVVGVTQDGAIGPVTLKATILADGDTVIKRLCAARLSFVQGLKTWSVFGRGWARRIADIEAKAMAMWLAKGKALTGRDRNRLDDEAEAAEETANRQNAGAGGAAAGGGAVGGGDALVTGEPNMMLIAGIVIVVGLVVAGLVIKARQNRARADAYEAAARS